MFDPPGETLRNYSPVAPVTTEDLVLISPELMSEEVKGRAAAADQSLTLVQRIACESRAGPP